MNVQLKDITVTARDGRVSHLEQVYIRGSHVRYFIVPDMLRYVSYIACFLSEANHNAGTHPCSEPEAHGALVLVLHVVGLRSSGRGPAEDEVGVLEGIELWSRKTDANARKDIPHAQNVCKENQDRYEVCST